MKECTKCKGVKEESGFAPRADTEKLRSRCRACTNSDNLQRYHDKPSTKIAHRKASRKSSLKRYNLTPESFEEMRISQGFGCAICDKHIEATSEHKYVSACVDHCHTTKAVRGLLCWDCNVGLGKFYDDPERLELAASYLRKEHTHGFSI